LNLYVADSGNSVIRQINLATKVVTTLAGNEEGNDPNNDDFVKGYSVSLKFIVCLIFLVSPLFFFLITFQFIHFLFFLNMNIFFTVVIIRIIS
jgi:hypothetical protein